MMFIPYAILLLLGARNSIAQRPSNTSTCDYYAQTLYGANTSTTQNQLIQGIVALAFGGGFNLSNVSSDITGILNPGTFQNLSVDLRPWFNGSIDSTNLNNQPVGIDWLDDGGTDPLYNFLSNQTSTVVLTNTTNEYRLFNHFFLAFAHIFGCTLPPPPLPSNGGGSSSGPLSLAYVHKYMNLNFTDLGHFIDQLTKSAVHFGFSDQDGETFSTQMNSLYNVRCAPPITLNPAQGPQLLSLCQASTCPLAEPNPDCAAYVNLTATGIGGGPAPSSSAASAPSSTSSASSSTVQTQSATSSSAGAQTTTAAPVSTSASPPLSTGAIAGVAVGGAAGLLILLYAVYIFGRRHRRRSNTPPPSSNQAPTDGAGGMAEYNPNYRPETTLYAPSTITSTTPKDQHISYASNSGAGGVNIAEMDSPRFRNSPQMGGAASPHHSLQQQSGYSPRTMSPVHYQQPAELEGAAGGGAGGYVDEQQQYYQQPQQYPPPLQQQQQQVGDWNRVGPDTIANPGQRYG